MTASLRGADRPRCIALMLTSAAPSMLPTRPIMPGRSGGGSTSIHGAGATSSQ